VLYLEEADINAILRDQYALTFRYDPRLPEHFLQACERIGDPHTAYHSYRPMHGYLSPFFELSTLFAFLPPPTRLMKRVTPEGKTEYSIGRNEPGRSEVDLEIWNEDGKVCLELISFADHGLYSNRLGTTDEMDSTMVLLGNREVENYVNQFMKRATYLGIPLRCPDERYPERFEAFRRFFDNSEFLLDYTHGSKQPSLGIK
jgi:hypothetical protein